MVRRTKEDALLTREQLLDAAEQVFRERGVGHASLAEVADAAGVTRGAVYWHFDSKAALFQAMVERAEMPQDASLQHMELAARVDPLAALRAGAIEALTSVARCERTRCVYEVVFLRCEYTEELAPVRARQIRSRQQCFQQIEKTMRAAVRRGQLPGKLDVACAARGLYAYIGGLIRDSLESPDQLDLARNAGTLVDFYLRGLVSTPSRPAPMRTAAVGASKPRTVRGAPRSTVKLAPRARKVVRARS